MGSERSGVDFARRVTDAVGKLGKQRENATYEKREKSAKDRAKKDAENEQLLNLKLTVYDETLSWPLKETISLLGLFNVFFLINVDSYTRDDLMSMVAVKLCASVIRPGLVLDNASFQALINFFDGMHVNPSIIKSLQDPSEQIVRSRRSGEWLLTDPEYKKYLTGDSRKEAEPLSQVVKLQTIAQMNLFRVEASLQSLALLLVAEKSVHDYSSDLFHEEGTRRTAFFRALLELANACTRASLAENLEKVFEDLVLNPLANLGQAVHPEQVRKLKQRQDLALLKLHQTVLSLDETKRIQFQDEAFEMSVHSQRKIEHSFRTLLFHRLRVICIFKLQLVNVSAYNETGRALKLAAWLANPNLSEKDVSVYWLVCFHATLESLGYDMDVLKAILDMWVPPSKTPQVPSLLVRGGAQVTEAKGIFLGMRALLKHVGRTLETTPLINLYRGHDSPFIRSVLGFTEQFPDSVPTGNARKTATSECDLQAEAGYSFRDIARSILKGHNLGPHMSEGQIENIVCALTQWFELEDGLHSFRDRAFKKSPPVPVVPETKGEPKKKGKPKKKPRKSGKVLTSPKAVFKRPSSDVQT